MTGLFALVEVESSGARLMVDPDRLVHGKGVCFVEGLPCGLKFVGLVAVSTEATVFDVEHGEQVLLRDVL